MTINSPTGPRLHINAPWWEAPAPETQNAMSWFMLETKRNVHCRLDVRMTSLEEVKRAAVMFDELSKKLQSVAFDGEADDVLRVLVARSEMKAVQRQFLQRKKMSGAKKNISTIRSVPGKRGVWKVNRDKLLTQVIETKGESENES